MAPSRDELLHALGVLEAAARDRAVLAALDAEERQRLHRAIAQVLEPDVAERRRLLRAIRRRESDAARAEDERALEGLGMRQLRALPVFQAPPPTKAVHGSLADEAVRGSLADEAVPTSRADEAVPTSLADEAVPTSLADEAVPTSLADEAEPATGADAGRAEGPELGRARDCYVCKRAFTRLHFFYDALCETCGALNWEKRNQTASLTGRVALVTGGRVKIGFHIALKLLRAGARVVVTTRFPRDAAQRFAREPDFGDFAERVTVYGLDLRHTPSVERFARHLGDALGRLDFIINNACQTVRRPPAFYQHLLAAERSGAGPEVERLLGAVPSDAAVLSSGDRSVPAARALSAPELTQVPLLPEDLVSGEHIFPEGRLDADLQQIDLRTTNSWRLRLAEVPTLELLEVQLVNAIAPFVLNARLKPLMLRHPSRDKHIVNVSAMEGQFYRGTKTDKHPHTNMAKAALNMLTRTSAQDYARDGIFMNSVDTGWVTDEDPAAHAERKAREGFRPPLDIVDGAARVLDPIFDGLRTGVHRYGLFWKDYAPTEW